jgi:hypothetical protein
MIIVSDPSWPHYEALCRSYEVEFVVIGTRYRATFDLEEQDRHVALIETAPTTRQAVHDMAELLDGEFGAYALSMADFIVSNFNRIEEACNDA